MNEGIANHNAQRKTQDPSSNSARRCTLDFDITIVNTAVEHFFPFIHYWCPPYICFNLTESKQQNIRQNLFSLINFAVAAFRIQF